jgi:hypothetical protein
MTNIFWLYNGATSVQFWQAVQEIQPINPNLSDKPYASPNPNIILVSKKVEFLSSHKARAMLLAIYQINILDIFINIFECVFVSLIYSHILWYVDISNSKTSDCIHDLKHIIYECYRIRSKYWYDLIGQYFLIGRAGSWQPNHVTIAIFGNTLFEGYSTLLADMGPYLSKETTLERMLQIFSWYKHSVPKR